MIQIWLCHTGQISLDRDTLRMEDNLIDEGGGK